MAKATVVDTTKTVAKDVVIQRSKDTMQILVPERMPLKEAAQWLLTKDAEEDKAVAILQEFDAFPLDGAVAFREALDEIYGFVSNADTPGWFGDSPPVMIGVPVGENEVRQVPWGRVKIPGIFGYLETSYAANPTPKFVLQGETKQRHLYDIDQIVTKVKEKLRNSSIYKGKAIRLDLSWIRQGQKFNPMGHAPKFSIPVDKVREDELVFPAKVQNDIELGLFTPIECANDCRNHRIPLKRGVLLAGDYGTGKTLTAYVTAKKATTNGWTFIYLSNVLDLAQGFQFAKQYAPAVIFAEDVDRVVGQQDRTESIDAVLNSFDGVDTKDVELITVLTTNHLDKLTPAILRPGRCDTLVQVTRPDADAAARLVRLYGRGLIADDADFARMGGALANHLPAEIREAVERAKLAAIRRLTVTGELKKTGTIQGHVREQDVLAAVQAMENQHRLLEPKEVDNRSPLEKCVEIWADRMADAVSDGMNKNAALAVNALQELGLKADDLDNATGYLSDVHDKPQLNGTAK